MREASNRHSSEPLKPGQFYGQVLRKSEAGGLILTEFRTYGAQKLPVHSHELASFNLLLGGNYWEFHGRRTATIQRLTTLFDPAGTTHRVEIGAAPLRVFTLEMSPEWVGRLYDYGINPAISIESRAGELSWLAVRLYREYRESRRCSGLAIEGLLLEMLALVGEPARPREKHPPAWLSRVTDLLRTNFHEPLTFKRVAAQVGVHPVHLSKVFRQFHHQGIGDYLQRLRLGFACEQLAQPELGLAEIATAAGFADQSHFTRVFKRFTGMTPGAFRATFKPHTTATSTVEEVRDSSAR